MRKIAKFIYSIFFKKTISEEILREAKCEAEALYLFGHSIKQTTEGKPMIKKKFHSFLFFLFTLSTLWVVVPHTASARISDVPIFSPMETNQIEQSINNVKNRLIGSIIPALCVLMVAIGCALWATGSQMGKYLLLGSLISLALALSADAIVSMLKQLIR